MGGEIADTFVIEIEASDRHFGFGCSGLFLNAQRAALAIEFDHTIGTGIVDLVGEHACASGAFSRTLEQIAKARAVKDIVPQHECSRATVHKLPPNQERLCEPFRLGLHRIADIEAKLCAVAKQAFKIADIFRGRDDQDIADSRHQQH